MGSGDAKGGDVEKNSGVKQAILSRLTRVLGQILVMVLWTKVRERVAT